jgi:putative transposase
VRQSDPARRVSSVKGNVSGRYPSRKMGRTIQFESHRNELAAILLYGHSPEILEFWDQPCRIKLNYQSKSGKQLGVWHTPDFFVIRADSAGWEECKTAEDLQRLSETNPNRYIQTDNGWKCPPGQKYAEQYGLTYHLRSSAEINWIYQRNMLFLEDYLRAGLPAVPLQIQNRIRTLVALQPGMTLTELIACAAPATVDDIYILIVTDELFVDMEAAPLAEPDRVSVFCEEQAAQNYKVEAPSLPRRSLLNPETGTLIYDLTMAGPEDLTIAYHRYISIAPDLGREISTQSERVPDRTKRRWIANYRAAENKYGVGLVGLIPRIRYRGNQTQRLPKETRALMTEFIDQQYETIKQQGKSIVYCKFALECEKRGLTPPTYKTWCHRINRRPREEQTRKREGARAAYQHQQFYWELELTTPRHGDRPFEIAHLDHTKLDIELVCSRTGQNLGRPWATMMTDAYTRRLLAIFLTYDPPSYRSCMMALRECVARFGRFPQALVVDGGKEFGSIYFETLLARYECTQKIRPSAQPRFGAICERLFGVTNTQFIHNLIGNTQITKQIRHVTAQVDPARHAQWSLGRLFERLCEWGYEIYDTNPHPALKMSPRSNPTHC